MNLKRNLERAAGELMAAGVPEPDLDAWYLLEYVTGVSRAAYFADPGRELTEAQQESFDACVKKRAGRIPLQHITGTQEFMGLSFRVNEHVLIPRQDTEILVEEALKMLKKRAVAADNRDGRTTEILDLCTGSGCILLSVLHYAGQNEHMNLRGTGSDLSGQALETARGNAERLGIRVLPMPFYKKDELFYEDITLTQEEFYQRLAEDADISTSQPSPADVMELWEELLEEYDEVIHIPMSSGLSSSCETAIMLSIEFDVRVHVVDNQLISVTQRQCVMDAF